MKHEEMISTQGYWIVQIQNDFYKALKKVQEERELSLNEIAQMMEKSPSRLSQIIHGDFNPKLETLVKYALDLGYVPELKFTPIQDYKDRKAKKSQLKGMVQKLSKPSLPRPPYGNADSSEFPRLGERRKRIFDPITPPDL